MSGQKAPLAKNKTSTFKSDSEKFSDTSDEEIGGNPIDNEEEVKLEEVLKKSA